VIFIQLLHSTEKYGFSVMLHFSDINSQAIYKQRD